MLNFTKKHYKKIIAFGIIKKIVLVYLLFYSPLFAGTYSGIEFSEYEEKGTLYFCNYYSYDSINSVVKDSVFTDSILVNRELGNFSTVSEIDSLSNSTASNLHKLKQNSHLIDWNIYLNDMGMTLPDTNFLYGLLGLLLGFTFLFFFIFVVVGSF